MRRKVIQLARFTQAVSLPKRWALKHNIKKGEDLEVDEKATSLIISASRVNTQPKKIEIDLEDISGFHKLMLVGLYTSGYDEIKVNFQDPKILERIEDIVEPLLGFEVINQGGKYCIIKDIASSEETQFSMILKRIFHIIKNNFNECEKALKNKELCNIPDMKKIDMMINKLSYLCERMINKSFDKTPYEYYLVCQLELIGDQYKYISNDLSIMSNVSDRFLNYYKKTANCFNKFYNVYYASPTNEDSTILEKEIRSNLVEFNKTMKGVGNHTERKLIQHLISVLSVVRHLNTRLSRKATN